MINNNTNDDNNNDDNNNDNNNDTPPLAQDGVVVTIQVTELKTKTAAGSINTS